jgi:hypothetical protein
MQHRTIVSLFVVIALLALGTAWAQARKTDAQVRHELIVASIAAYHGSCPCPYNVDRAGRSCGRRSAYSRPGGASPLCYEQDVTQKMVNDYRKRTGQ